MTAVVSYAEFDYYKANIDGGTASGGAAVDFLSDTIKIALVLSAAAPAVATHDFWNDLSGSELANGNGYTTGGETLASKTTSAPAAGVVGRDCADVTWTFTANKTFRYGVIYKDTGVSSTSPLMFLIEFFASDTLVIPSTFTWSPHSSGIFTLT